MDPWSHCRPLSRDGSRLPCARATRSRPRCYARCGVSRCTCTDEIERRYPKVLRRVGGYNLDAFVDPDAPFNLTKLMVGSEGTLGVVLEAKIALVPLPKAKAVLAIQFADLLEALEATPVDPGAPAVGDRSHGRLHPRQHQTEPGARSHAPHVHRRRPGRAALRRVLRRRRGELPPRLDGARARPRAPGSLGYRYFRAHWISRRRRRSGACAKRRSASRWR